MRRLPRPFPAWARTTSAGPLPCSGSWPPASPSAFPPWPRRRACPARGRSRPCGPGRRCSGTPAGRWLASRGWRWRRWPHRLRHAGTDLSAWCAWDPQFLALVIGDLDVATADPVTCEAISNRVSTDGIITGASHPDPVLSFLRPGQPWHDDVMTTFCHYALHFTSLGTAERWTTGPAARRRAAGRRGRRALLSPVRRDAANRPGWHPRGPARWEGSSSKRCGWSRTAALPG